MIPYFQAGQSFVVAKGNPEGDQHHRRPVRQDGRRRDRHDRGRLPQRRPATTRASGLSKACTDAGKAGHRREGSSRRTPTPSLALLGGQVDAYFADSPVGGYYTVQHPDQFELSAIPPLAADQGRDQRPEGQDRAPRRGQDGAPVDDRRRQLPGDPRPSTASKTAPSPPSRRQQVASPALGGDARCDPCRHRATGPASRPAGARRRLPAARRRPRRLLGRVATSTAGTSSSTRSSSPTASSCRALADRLDRGHQPDHRRRSSASSGRSASMAKRRPIRWLANVYVWIFRGTPLLVQISAPLLRPERRQDLRAGRTSTSSASRSRAPSRPASSPSGVNEGAYMTEIVRAGIISVDPGQMEAAKSLGHDLRQGDAPDRPAAGGAGHHSAARQRVQQHAQDDVAAGRHQRPRAVRDLLDMNAAANVFHPFEFFLAAAVWYLLLTTIWGVIQAWIERRLGRGAGGEQPAEPARAAVRPRDGRAMDPEPGQRGPLMADDRRRHPRRDRRRAPTVDRRSSSRRPTSTSGSAGSTSSRASR